VRRMRITLTCLSVVGLLAVVASCVPLPIPHTELATPKVRGTLTHGDGSPIVGAVVAVTNEGHDAACQKFAVRDTTDADGHFELPMISEHRRILWITMFENFGQTWYELCVQPSDSLARAQRYARASVVTHRTGGTLRCMDWEAEAMWHLICEDPLHHAVVEGGRWTQGQTQGTYRLIDADPVRFQSALAVQWIADTATDGRSRLRATAVTPAGEPLESGTPQLVQKEGRWYVGRVSAAYRHRRKVVFDLGAPGDLRLLPDSTSKRLFP
jgi:hypothetical protein